MRIRSCAIVLLSLLLWCLPLDAARAGDVRSALSYVPSDSLAVVAADIDQLRASPLFRPLFDRIVRETGAAQELAEIQKAAGIDLRRDVRSLVVAFPPEFVKDDDELILIVEAPIAQQRMLAYLRKEGVKVQRKHGPGGAYWVVGRGEPSLAFRGRYLILGGRKALPQSLEAARGRSVLHAGALSARLRKMGTRHGAFALVELPPKISKKLSKGLPGGGRVDAVQVTLDARGGLKLAAAATTSSPKTAQQLLSLAKPTVAQLGSMKEARQLGLDQLLSKLRWSVRGPDLAADMSLSAAEVQTLVKALRRP